MSKTPRRVVWEYALAISKCRELVSSCANGSSFMAARSSSSILLARLRPSLNFQSRSFCLPAEIRYGVPIGGLKTSVVNKYYDLRNPPDSVNVQQLSVQLFSQALEHTAERDSRGTLGHRKLVNG